MAEESTIKVCKNKDTGVCFAYTERLAAQPYMIVGFLNLKTQVFRRSDEPDASVAAPKPSAAPAEVVTDPAPAAPSLAKAVKKEAPEVKIVDDKGAEDEE